MPFELKTEHMNQATVANFSTDNAKTFDGYKECALDSSGEINYCDAHFCELGKGNVDFLGIVAELKERDYSGWIVVEQDVLPGMGAPLESAKKSRAHLRGMGL